MKPSVAVSVSADAAHDSVLRIENQDPSMSSREDHHSRKLSTGKGKKKNHSVHSESNSLGNWFICCSTWAANEKKRKENKRNH